MDNQTQLLRVPESLFIISNRLGSEHLRMCNAELIFSIGILLFMPNPPSALVAEKCKNFYHLSIKHGSSKSSSSVY